MKSLFIAEWLTAIGIIVFRQVKKNHAPPVPGALLSVSGLFIILAIVADAGPQAEKVAALFGAGLDIAAFMNLFETGVAKAPGNTAPAPAAGTVAA